MRSRRPWQTAAWLHCRGRHCAQIPARHLRGGDAIRRWRSLQRNRGAV